MPETPVWIPPSYGPVPMPVTTASGMSRYDVSYSLIPGFRPIELQLYTPSGASPAPVIVWIHGGGYAGGTRKEGTPWLEATNYISKAVERGFAIASIDYRLGREAVFPAAVNDAHAALRWLAKFASKLNLDVTRTILWGESAGGHLAAITANTFGDDFFEGNLGAEKNAELRVVALVDWYGASDLNTIVRPMDGTDASMPEVARFPPEYFNLGADRWLDPELRRKASPTSYIHAQSPSTLLVHGDIDTMVPIQQSEVLAAALNQFGVDHEFTVIPGGEHGFMGLPQERINQIVDSTLDWIEDQVK